MGFVLLFAWAGHLVLFTGPGATCFAALAWLRRGSATFWAVTSLSALAALSAQLASLAHAYRGAEQVGVWDATFRMLFSSALFATLLAGALVALAGIANTRRRQRFPGLIAGLALSLALQLPLSMYAHDVFALIGIRLVN